MQLPLDPAMMLSVINLNLRDKYANLEDLCKSEDLDMDYITEKLAAIDYYYEADVNQFR